MEQHNEALATALRGDEWRAVAQRRPRAIAQRRIGLCQHLSADGDVIRNDHTEERTFAAEGGERLRLLPGETSPENAPAAPELYGHEIVVSGGKPRPGKAAEDAAVLKAARQRLTRLGHIADIGENQHRQALVEELVHRLPRRTALGDAHVGEGAERAREII